MTITAQSIIRRAGDVLMDTTAVRWQASELVRWLNDAQREIVVVRKDATSRTTTVTLAAGPRQNLDDMSLTPAPAALIGVSRNMATASTKGAVRIVDRRLMDAQVPGWYGAAGAISIRHYMFDPREPRVFYVDPPALATAQLEVTYSGLPVEVPVPADGTSYASVVGNLSVPDIYANAVLDYVMYRAYNKDAEFAGNAARSQIHLAAFNGALGVEVKSTLSVQPQINPGMPSAAGT